MDNFVKIIKGFAAAVNKIVLAYFVLVHTCEVEGSFSAVP